MAVRKEKPSGGSGGKRGHSNMSHWQYTSEVKAGAKKARRDEDAWSILESLSGTVEGPRDWASEADHYLYGTAKRGGN